MRMSPLAAFQTPRPIWSVRLVCGGWCLWLYADAAR